MKKLVVACALAGVLFASAAADRGLPQATYQAARKGDAAAQYKIGESYDLGRGVAQDYKEAVQWYRRSAEQGNAQAQFALGEMYKNGDGVAKDLVQAVHWYRLAAEQGNPGAQLLLGVLYESGLGVPLDFKEAAKWYRQSAAQGDARAQLLLGVCYQLGQGVSRNFVVAYALYSVSARNDSSPGNPAPNHRAQLARSMSPPEVDAAKSLSGEIFRPGNFSQALDRYLQISSAKP